MNHCHGRRLITTKPEENTKGKSSGAAVSMVGLLAWVDGPWAAVFLLAPTSPEICSIYPGPCITIKGSGHERSQLRDVVSFPPCFKKKSSRLDTVPARPGVRPPVKICRVDACPRRESFQARVFPCKVLQTINISFAFHCTMPQFSFHALKMLPISH